MFGAARFLIQFFCFPLEFSFLLILSVTPGNTSLPTHSFHHQPSSLFYNRQYPRRPFIGVCVRARARARVCVHMRARVWACVRAWYVCVCARACVCVCARARVRVCECRWAACVSSVKYALRSHARPGIVQILFIVNIIIIIINTVTISIIIVHNEK